MQLSNLEPSNAMTINSNTVYRLEGAIQHYDWGGFDFIPKLIQKENAEQQPFAELWMGTHQRGPAKLRVKDQHLPLAELIKETPTTLLGDRVAAKFDNQLPFLFKVLDVNKMLSIQSHPTKEKAVIGFQKENEQGIPLSAFNRVFKDDNHKPEIMVALSDFWLLHGFQHPEAIAQIIEEIPEFSTLKSIFVQHSIFDLYKTIMEWPQEKINEILTPLGKRLQELLEAEALHPDQADYWAALAFKNSMESANQIDRGIFSIYFFNLVKLQEGEAIFQDAGVPHAYLRGTNMELMANSDNVFRGGLTKKHIAVPELLANLVFDPIDPTIIQETSLSETESVFKSPAPDFELRKLKINKDKIGSYAGDDSPAILILMEGRATVEETIALAKGQIVFVPANTSYSISASSDCIFFKALVP